MQARLTTRPEQDVIAAIRALDLESVKLRVMDPELGEGWTQDYADSIETAYRNYLTMLVKYPDDAEDIMLSEDVDEFWHTHILHTKKYADDCQTVFGNFLHHNPRMREHSSSYIERRVELIEKTRRMYQQEFGSAKAATAAWAGADLESLTMAYCDATMRRDGPAYCDAGVSARKSAYCDASFQAAKTAYCDASARASKSAYCDASIQKQKAAYCDASIPAAKGTYCDASVRASGLAYCDATMQGKQAAYCDASAKVARSAYCDAGVRVENVA